MTSKNRVKTLEDKVGKPDRKIITIYEDPDNPGIFYTTHRPEDGKRLSEDDIKALGQQPGVVILRVQYDKPGGNEIVN